MAGFIGRSLQYDLQWHEIDEGLIYTHRQLDCYAFPTRHRVKRSYGFVFQEKPRRRFQPEAAERMGIPPGPQRRRLLAGESLRGVDGRIVRPDDVLGPEEPGKKLVYVSDSMYFDGLKEAAAGANCLISEATFLQADAELAAEVGHMTAAQAASVARDARRAGAVPEPPFAALRAGRAPVPRRGAAHISEHASRQRPGEHQCVGQAGRISRRPSIDPPRASDADSGRSDLDEASARPFPARRVTPAKAGVQWLFRLLDSGACPGPRSGVKPGMTALESVMPQFPSP